MAKDSTRITVMLDGDLDKRLRGIQAKRIRDEQSSCSFSKVLNEVVRKQLKV